MTQLQTWTITGIAAVALALSALLATGALTSAQSPDPSPTPSATEAPDGGDSTPAPDATDDTPNEEREIRVGGCGGKLAIKDAAAEVLGLSEEELITALMDGQTLAEVAQAQGMSVEDFRAALVTSVTADLQAQLDAGEITQEEFDEITADLEARIDEIINAEGGIRFHRRSFDGDGNGDGAIEPGARFRFERAPFDFEDSDGLEDLEDFEDIDA